MSILEAFGLSAFHHPSRKYIKALWKIMARVNTSGEMMVHEAEKVVVAGAHIVFTYWTKSRVLLNPICVYP
jgi:hypothetical protein